MSKVREKMTSQTIIEFLNDRKINWFPIALKIGDGKKIPLNIQHETYGFSCPKMTDFEKERAKGLCLTRQTLLTNPKFKDTFKYIAIDTSKVFHIDIDSEEYPPVYNEIMEVAPYFKSVTKSYGRHILITSSDGITKKRCGFLDAKKQTSGFGVELLCGQWSFAPLDAVIYNADKGFYKFEDLGSKIDVEKNKEYEKQKECVKIKLTNKKRKICDTPPVNTEDTENTEKTDDKFLELLFNVIGNEKTENDEWVVCYEYWFIIACVLKSNKYDKSVFLEYSRHDVEGASKTWDAIRYKPMNIHTLQNIAKKINYDGYKTWLTKNNQEILKESVISQTTEDVTRAFYQMFGHEFVYRKEKLYHYNGVVWDKNKLSSRQVFVGDFTKLYQNYEIELATQIRDCDDENKKKSMELLKENVASLIKKLKTNTFINHCVKESLNPYIQNDDVAMETNEIKFCFKDKVYDLEKMCFVEPDPTDMCVLTTGYEYRKPPDEDIEELRGVIEKIFPDESERTLYMCLLATGLYGKTLEKFTLANGSGRNGKGVINELAMATLGNSDNNYGYTCANDVLLNSIKGGPNPAVANMNHKRLILYREPDTSAFKRINMATVKEITGGDELNARNMYVDDTQTNLKGTHILECNEKPKMSGTTTDAISKRLIDMLFRSMFVQYDDEVDEESHIYKADDKIKTKGWKERMKIPMFHILLEYWEIYLKKNKNIDALVPQSIRVRSREYLQESNEIQSWFLENYTKVEGGDPMCFVQFKEVYEDFKSSPIYLNMSKKEKRDMTRKNFISIFAMNPYMRRDYKELYRPTIDGERKKFSTCLLGYKKNPRECIVSDDTLQ